ncbi:MAG: S8 family serine peptidase [Galbitalea sp.]
MRARVALGAVVALATATLFVPASSGALAAAPASAPGIAKTDYIRDGEYWLDQYNIQSAWSTTEGKGITIAVIDTGVDGTVPDLAGAVSGGTDFSGDGAANGERPVGTADDRDHGTMVASLAAGRGTGDGAGLIGVAPQAKILSISIGFGAAAPTRMTRSPRP